MRNDSDIWSVLRCAGKETLTLADKLRDNGVEVFAPKHTVRVRLPRSHKYVMKDYPVLPSFLFLPCSQLALALQTVDRDAGQMIIRGEFVTITEIEVDHMRQEIQRRLPNPKPKVKRAKPIVTGPPPEFKAGELVEVSMGPFIGRTAKVLWAAHDGVRVEFEDFSGHVSFSAFLLRRKGA